MIKAASKLKFAGSSNSLSSVSISSLIPSTSQFITYEGSLTQPSCQESVTWIIPNKPIYISEELLDLLSNLMQGTQDDPRAPLAGNIRPTQPSHGRLIRTNINFDESKDPDCKEFSEAFQYESRNLWSTSANNFV